MSGRFVRQSSYRHVFGEAPKKEQQFTDVRPNPNGDGNCLAATGDYVAYPMAGGGGPVQVLDVSKTGRQGKTTIVNQHKMKVTDLKFNPFNQNMLATASEDCTIKMTVLNKDDVAAAKKYETPDALLKGHQKKVVQVAWHPSAANVLASVSFDNSVKVWDVTKQACTGTVKSEKGAFSAAWNSDGSLIGTCDKAKEIHIFDPRTNGEGLVVGKGPDGTKTPRFIWAEKLNKIVVLGFTRSSTRQYMIYDMKAPGECITQENIDQSAGLMMEMYDQDNNILWMAGKGDSSVKYFELTESAPFIHYLSEFTDPSSQKGIGWAPKYSCDTTKCEIAKCYRVLRDTIQPVSFCVPRKSEMFQEDIYPETQHWEAAATAEDYAGGKNAAPKMVTMDPEQRGDGPKEVAFEAKKSYEQLEEELAAALKKIAQLEGK